ncbi:carboxymuconolactone decarboxylase family protein [Lutibacter sp.]|uniref:carboxymuconolactone decarboxylase family protein n=1 Tax=Lutibacter sp. TaxID=1925666 RepID=UPI003565373A
MITDYCKYENDIQKLLEQLEYAIPYTMTGLKKLQKVCISSRVLSNKTKELIALGISISSGCKEAIAIQIENALKAGASSEEIYETMSVAILMGGKQAMFYGCEALEALNQFIVLEK